MASGCSISCSVAAGAPAVAEILDDDVRWLDTYTAGVARDTAREPGPGVVGVPADHVLPTPGGIGASHLEAPGVELHRHILAGHEEQPMTPAQVPEALAADVLLLDDRGLQRRSRRHQPVVIRLRQLHETVGHRIGALEVCASIDGVEWS